MDKEQARFILHSFRPDGADAQDPAFTEALTLAAEDRELGEWLSHERAHDAEFSAMLNEVEIPADLREAIKNVISAHDQPLSHDLIDCDFIGALAQITPPQGLREQILAAAKMESTISPFPAKTHLKTRWFTGLAAAAALMFGIFIVFGPVTTPVVASTTPPVIQKTALEYFQSPLFSLEHEYEQQAALFMWLESKGLPIPATLPVGLKNLPTIGCRELTIGPDNIRASLICFKPADGNTVHLVVLKKEQLSSKLPTADEARKNCRSCTKSGWATAQWSDEKNAYFLFGKRAPTELAGIF